jgi:hypothetical protein
MEVWDSQPGWMNLHPVVTILGISVIAIATLRVLGRMSVEYVRVVVYALSFTTFVTLLSVWWLRSHGAFDAQGRPVGPFGNSAMALFRVIVDTKDEGDFLAALVAVGIVPQLVSYFILAMYGYASNIVLASKMLTWYMWLVAKSTLTLSGVMLGLACFGRFAGWHHWLGASTGQKLVASGLALVPSFQMVIMLADYPRLWKRVKLWPNAYVQRFHKWATRNAKKSQPEAVSVDVINKYFLPQVLAHRPYAALPEYSAKSMKWNFPLSDGGTDDARGDSNIAR